MPNGKDQYLVLDDDATIAPIVARVTGASVFAFDSTKALLARMNSVEPSAVFVDVHLGDSESGLALIPTIRAQWPYIPILVLTSDSAAQAMETALSVGADDFLLKPIEPAELTARLRLRFEEKANLSVKQSRRFHDLTLNIAHHRLSAHGESTYLSPTALNLLSSLMDLAGSPVERPILKRRVWGRLTLTDNALDRKVCEVRKALQQVKSTARITTVHGVGYELTSPAKLSADAPLAVAPKVVIVPSDPARNDVAVRILLVEDSDSDAVIMRETLRSSDAGSRFELKRAKTLASAISEGQNAGFDIALLDLSLPDSQGIETFRQFAGALPDLPVVVLSGMSDEKLALEAVECGAQDYLSKNDLRAPLLGKSIRYAMLRYRVSVLQQAALRERQSQVEAVSALKTQFLANMSHEIRTPMNAVIGMTSILSRASLTAEQAECVDIIRTSGQALLQILNEILDFSKFQSGKVSLEIANFELRPLVESVVDLFSVDADQKGVALLQCIAPDVPKVISGDSSRLRQVLVNVIGNALKFTAQGRVQINVTRSTVGEREILAFKIQDTGIGIKAAEKPRLFQVFNQANLSTTKKFGGTGLGLAISKTILEMMEGSISFDSDGRSGTTFFISIPLVHETQTTFKPRADLSQSTALIFSDCDHQATFLSEQLANRGLKNRVIAQEAALLREIKKSRAKDELLVVFAASEVRADDLRQKIESKSPSAPVLWIVPKRIESDSWSGDFVLRHPYNQSSLYEKVARLLTGEKKTSDLPLREAPFQPIQMPTPVLVAEDNPVNQRVVTRLLEKIGLRCDVVSNGAEALRAVQAGEYSAVLMDCSMPEMDGWTATTEIRKLGLSVPIIAMTANAFSDDRERCFSVGMDDYLAKPLTLEDLHAALSQYGGHPEASLKAAVPAADAELEVLNRDKLAQLNALGDSATEDQDFIIELKQLFLQHAPATYAELLDLIESGAPQDLRAKAHRLKGLAGNLAAEKLTDVCFRIESCAANSRPEEARQHRGTLQTEWEQLIQYLRKDLSAQGVG